VVNQNGQDFHVSDLSYLTCQICHMKDRRGKWIVSQLANFSYTRN